MAKRYCGELVINMIWVPPDELNTGAYAAVITYGGVSGRKMWLRPGGPRDQPAKMRNPRAFDFIAAAAINYSGTPTQREAKRNAAGNWDIKRQKKY